MRLVGAVLVIAACGMMGLTVARSYTAQAQSIKQLLTMLQLLETEIGYSRSALPEALGRIGEQMGGMVGAFLRVVNSHIHANPGDSFSQAWSQGVRWLRGSGLPTSVLDDLTVLGDSMGTSGVEDQRRHLQVARVRLEHAYHEAEDDKRANFRLWSYLGFGTGLLLILLII